MRKDILIKYRDNHQELDLLGALEQKGLIQYDNEYKKLIEILCGMLSITNDNNIPIQQFLFNSVYKVLDLILLSGESIKEFVSIISDSIPNDNSSVNAFIFRFILNIKDNSEGIAKKNNIDLLKKELEEVNIKALTNAIDERKDYDLIIEQFYNCVTDMEANRRIILHPDAIEKFHNYIAENPTNYLKYFIRPYYTGPNKHNIEFYLHVGEPFCSRIFPNDSFTEFLDTIGDKIADSSLLEDIKEFYNRAISKQNGEDETVILYSPKFTPQYEIDRLPLTSSNHKHVRPICLPPDYSEGIQ
ncbi:MULTISPECIES: hypothetical protein [Sphingobacterium]|uniref:hypothetical protein n=1 Tax=Sphingobacterium TaxID=28453 RepID=UPI00257D4011|nr:MULTISPECIES: hypothetical protein [Sphingobacterium]